MTRDADYIEQLSARIEGLRKVINLKNEYLVETYREQLEADDKAVIDAEVVKWLASNHSTEDVRGINGE